MAKDPAFLFYTNDFQSGTLFFTDEQVGKYLRLLMAQHQHGHLSEKQVLFICKTQDEDILSKFTKDSDGLYFNEKLESIIDARSKFSESRRNNRLGKTKQLSESEEINNTSSSYVQHMEDENENKDLSDNKNIKGVKSKSFVPNFDSYPTPYRQGLKDWWGYKVEKKQKYTQMGWDALVEKALKMNAAKFSESIKNCMANNWAGFFGKDTPQEKAEIKGMESIIGNPKYVQPEED